MIKRSIIFEKRKFYKCKESFNIIQRLTNEKKVIKFLTAFHTTPVVKLKDTLL